MSRRADAVDLARFLAFDGQPVEEIARQLTDSFGMGEAEALELALKAVAPEPPTPPVPGTGGADPLTY
jgi:hypothetical protein